MVANLIYEENLKPLLETFVIKVRTLVSSSNLYGISIIFLTFDARILEETSSN